MVKNLQTLDAATKGPFARLLDVNIDGYQWDTDICSAPGFNKQDEDKGAPWLVDSPIGVEKTVRRYAPFSEPNLHRQLAGLTPSQQNIKNFADKYGLLGHGVALCYTDRSNPLQIGESFHFWSQEIERLGALINLWDCIQHERFSELYNYIAWHERPRSVSIKLVHPNGKLLTSHLIAREDYLPHKEIITRWKTGLPIGPSTYFVHQQINERLRKHVSPYILPFYNNGEILMFPDCLLSTLYVLFALEVSGRMQPSIICSGCGAYFIPKNRKQKYCKPSCSKLRYYHKMKEKK